MESTLQSSSTTNGRVNLPGAAGYQRHVLTVISKPSILRVYQRANAMGPWGLLSRAMQGGPALCIVRCLVCLVDALLCTYYIDVFFSSIRGAGNMIRLQRFPRLNIKRYQPRSLNNEFSSASETMRAKP